MSTLLFGLFLISFGLVLVNYETFDCKTLFISTFAVKKLNFSLANFDFEIAACECRYFFCSLSKKLLYRILIVVLSH